MSHVTGTVQTLAAALDIGPDSGTAPNPPGVWATTFAPAPAPGGTKLLILHLRNVSLPASNQLEVDLGYGSDVFTAADGAEFWTRPINVYALPRGGAQSLCDEWRHDRWRPTRSVRPSRAARR